MSVTTPSKENSFIADCRRYWRNLQQKPQKVLVRVPGAHTFGEPEVAAEEAKKHWEFALLNLVAYAKAVSIKNALKKMPASSPNFPSESSPDYAMRQFNPEVELATGGWLNCDRFVNNDLDAAFKGVHLRLEVWKKDDNSAVAVAFGGTVATSWRDWRANLRWFLPRVPDEYSVLVTTLACCPSGKRSYARQVVGCLCQKRELVDSLRATIHRLPNPADGPAPAKHVLNAFEFALTDSVAGPSRRSSVSRGAARASIVLRHMGRHIVRAARRHEAGRVVILSAPTVMDVPANRAASASISAAASRSTVPLACVTRVSRNLGWLAFRMVFSNRAGKKVQFSKHRMRFHTNLSFQNANVLSRFNWVSQRLRKEGVRP